ITAENYQLYEHLVGSVQKNQISHNEENLSANITNLMVKLEWIKQLLELGQLENQQKSELIAELNSQIKRMQQYIDDQKREIEELKTIKYSIARSKIIINIDNHITNLGSEYRFQKWLEKLSKHEESLPESLLFLAFDNKQRGQKNYLDRGFNTVIYHVVTSFVVFNIALLNKIQYTNSSWAYNSFDRSQYEELFDVSSQIQKVLDEELNAYHSEVFNLLVKEKLSSNNLIDSLISSIEINITNMKICSSCNQKNIENQKRICPKCGKQLLTLAELQKEEVIENNIINKLTYSFIFKPYSVNDKQNVTSFTQQVTDPRVNIPEIYFPDLININSNSIMNIEKVLLHIEMISGIKSGIHKWIAIVCDGILYHYTIKLKEKFPWLVLILGQLHEEMNMLRAFVELNWEIDIK
ncbi:3792_t:CDS:2, partial [Scutellospora calospora]